jgi:carbonic anhydrase
VISSLVRDYGSRTPKIPTADQSSIEYAACKNGTQQSPIDFLPSHGLSKLHKPSFHNYDRNVTGDLFNWGFGPSFTCDTTDGITSLPTLKWDDKTAYLIGFHLHFPSEHTVNGEHHRAELHLVHADASGNPAAVLGIFIDIGEFSPSFATVPAVPGPDDTTVVHGVPLNMYMDIQEAGHFDKFWTYQGSLTTPPCKEGLRWFVSEKVQTVSREQWAGLKTLRKFSSRETQEIINQNVNL